MDFLTLQEMLIYKLDKIIKMLELILARLPEHKQDLRDNSMKVFSTTNNWLDE